jgi:YceI-like domain
METSTISPRLSAVGVGGQTTRMDSVVAMGTRNGLRLVLVFTGVVLAALLGAANLAQPQAPSGKPASRPGDVELANSRVFTFVGATGFGHEHGVEGRLVSGNLQLGAHQNAGELVFDMKSFDADTPAARKYVGLQGESDDATRKEVNDNRLGADVLDVAKFPTAKFVIQSALSYNGGKPGSPPQYLLDGRFTMHGVTKHLRILAQAEESNGMIPVRTRFDVLQSQFGITPFSKLLDAIGVADKLTIYGDAWIDGRKCEARFGRQWQRRESQQGPACVGQGNTQGGVAAGSVVKPRNDADLPW